MAELYIPSHTSLRRHPKTKRFARALHVHDVQAIGHLHVLWWWAMEYAPDGDVTRYRDDLADAAEWDGDVETFITALLDAGFLDYEETGNLRLHDWNDYGGRLIEKRNANAERMRNARAPHVRRTTDARAPLEESREEESREEQKGTPPAPAREGPTKVEVDGDTTPVLTMFAAYAEGAGIGTGTSEWLTRQQADLPALRNAVHAGLDPGKLERMTRYVAEAWRVKGITVTPKVEKVLAAESEFDRWEAAGCPSATARAPNGYHKPTHMDAARAMAEKARLLEAQGL